MKRLIFFTAIALFSAPQTDAAEMGRAASALDRSGFASQNQAWWDRFGDAELVRLLDLALKANPDVGSAEARIREARADKLAEAAHWWPNLNTRASLAREETSAAVRPPNLPFSRTTNLYTAALDASWELDVFGRTRSAVETAAATVSAAEEGRHALFLTLTAEVADTYLELRGLQERAAVVRKNVESQREIVSLTHERVSAGISPALVASQSDALLADTQAVLPQIEEGVRNAIHRLAFLCGQAPDGLGKQLEQYRSLPQGPRELPEGGASDFAKRRPDVRRAERLLAAATSRLSQARAERYPTVRIAATAGVMSREADTVGQRENRDWSVGPEVRFPLFRAGEITARIRQFEAARDRESAELQNRVLRAMADVENALAAVKNRDARLASLTKAEAAHRLALEDAQRLFQAGGVDFLNVLDTQRAVLVAQERVAVAKTDAIRARILCYKSFGGGW